LGYSNFLDSELEMTMKRPAVRLESAFASEEEYSGNGVPPTPQLNLQEEPMTSLATPASNSGTSSGYKGRLLQAAQRQQAGDYDGAVQDYRAVIRAAPELLGEVIAKIRELLAQAPKYSAGYRVLGDAYMRHGEYLLAMEAYNNALTMTKKARS
jgi:tetratricopeptide (TPR) repeat protein